MNDVSRYNNSIFPFILFAVLSLISIGHADDTLIDAREGENILLKCRFSSQHSTDEFSYYWARNSGTNFENVAISGVPLASNYR